jgi:hypothetical protein
VETQQDLRLTSQRATFSVGDAVRELSVHKQPNIGENYAQPATVKQRE